MIALGSHQEGGGSGGGGGGGGGAFFFCIRGTPPRGQDNAMHKERNETENKNEMVKPYTRFESQGHVNNGQPL